MAKEDTDFVNNKINLNITTPRLKFVEKGGYGYHAVSTATWV